MTACDFGGPCDCRGCREAVEHHPCPKCQAVTTISILRTATREQDHKGSSGYSFHHPIGPVQHLACYNCQADLGLHVYDEVVASACDGDAKRRQAVREGRFCSSCKKLEGEGWSRLGILDAIRLHPSDGGLLCQDCLADLVQRTTPDPSNKTEKFAFDQRKREWVLAKIRIACSDCQRPRWVNVENQFKTRCLTCWTLWRSRSGSTSA